MALKNTQPNIWGLEDLVLYRESGFPWQLCACSCEELWRDTGCAVHESHHTWKPCGDMGSEVPWAISKREVMCSGDQWFTHCAERCCTCTLLHPGTPKVPTGSDAEVTFSVMAKNIYKLFVKKIYQLFVKEFSVIKWQL